MPKTCGYVLEREIVDVLVDKNPHISADQISEAGGGVVTLVLSVESARRMRVYRLAKELRFHSRYSAARTVAVSMPTQQGPAWEVVPLSFLQGLADEAVLTKDQRRLEAALSPRV
ncbi:hypothetical protein GTY75_05020 [Streptomyces sp. SID8381]|uniref:hypothetical protein n=1 Tax=unclassified Streptomyces TaxID=2593676 RepID=UPI00037B00D5|nr:MULTISPECIES: hypothetical protein [unclassified Streptomyces]MYX26036.1 hypothetical protein [Streptomyces sp. SID8381]